MNGIVKIEAHQSRSHFPTPNPIHFCLHFSLYTACFLIIPPPGASTSSTHDFIFHFTFHTSTVHIFCILDNDYTCKCTAVLSFKTHIVEHYLQNKLIPPHRDWWQRVKLLHFRNKKVKKLVWSFLSFYFMYYKLKKVQENPCNGRENWVSKEIVGILPEEKIMTGLSSLVLCARNKGVPPSCAKLYEAWPLFGVFPCWQWQVWIPFSLEEMLIY